MIAESLSTFPATLLLLKAPARSLTEDRRGPVRKRSVDAGETALHEPFDISLAPTAFVLWKTKPSERTQNVTANVPGGDPRLLGVAPGHAAELLASLLGQRRDRNTDHRLRGLSCETEAALRNRVLDQAKVARVEGTHDKRHWLCVDERELLERSRGAVIDDADGVEKRRARASGPERGEALVERVQRAIEPDLGVEEQFGRIAVSSHPCWSS